MANEVIFKEEEYKRFLKILSAFKETCSDVDIYRGQIFQKSNDSLYIYMCDLRSFLGENDFPITNLKQKLNLFKLFKEPIIIFGNDNVRIQEDIVYIDITKPLRQYLDNRYMEDINLDSIVNISPENKITEVNFDRGLLNKIKVISHNFGTENMTILFEDSKAKFIVQNTIANQKALVAESELETVVGGDSTIPLFFNMKLPDAKIEIFLDSETLVLYYKITSKIEDVDLVIFSKSKLSI
ncbi:MAG: hypothetical protein KatS3mg002_0440 [Candidatus Woesearchaeota archaeon]|nr:MAG: hypothetical protein KatS3mg002_0440 [Candidatus Woesearchaeota archaeon]